ncbi:MAG TPA: hypothetical protein VFT62_09480 [Mycobacteriales bacterium]|nr:hypothetical protein [Mycobacteriales bacterium]
MADVLEGGSTVHHGGRRGGITTDLDVVEGDVRKPGQARQLPGRG